MKRASHIIGKVFGVFHMKRLCEVVPRCEQRRPSEPRLRGKGHPAGGAE